MSNQNKIKIFISAHKPTEYVKNEIFSPVQVGAAIKGRKKLPGFFYDNDGENISDKNPRFCELTAQYWAWKNQSADYFGFFHYRRYLSFSGSKYRLDDWGNVIADCIDDDSIRKFRLDDKSISDLVSENDIILPEAKDITSMPGMGNNMRKQYIGSGFLYAKDLDIMLDVIEEKYPEFLPYATSYLNGHKTYLNNMFIMKKEIFNDYCKWLFDILLECDNRIDYSDYSVEAIRTPGHLAERLLNIYIAYLKDNKNLKIKELQTVAFLETDPFPKLSPAFEKNNVAIAMSANDFYVPFLAAVLTSIRENSVSSNNYDIFIMSKDISPDNKTRLINIFSDKNNFSLRFIDIKRFESKFSNLFIRGHFAVETWFRLLLPEVLAEYNKILYIDSDLIANADLADLYNTDVSGYLLAACHDADTAGLYNDSKTGKKEYMDDVLKIKKPYDYFQAGVILFNLDEFRKTYTTNDMLKKASSYNWELLDQDVLNYLAQDKVKFVDMSWNVMFDWNGIRVKNIISKAPKRLYDEYMEAHKMPKIIHYAGPDKPWHQPQSDYSEIFWKYSRMTEYYEEVILRMNDAYVFGFYQKTKFKNKVRRKVIEKILPRGSERREKVKKIYFKFKNIK